jgi:cytoskeletal protein CcmA (bactofilin family)
MDKTEKSAMSTPATVVGPNTHIKGSVEGDEDLRVLGRVDGNITLTRSLSVDPSGVVVADIHVQQAVISGVVVGNVTATDLVRITEEGRVVGDLSAPRVVLVEGATFKGNIDMGEASDRAAPQAVQHRANARPAPSPRPSPEPRPEPRTKPAPPPPPRPRERRPAPRKSASTAPATESKADAATRAVAEAIAKTHPADNKRSSGAPKPPTTAGKKTRARRR